MVLLLCSRTDRRLFEYARGSVIVMILQEVDIFYIFLQGFAILGDMIPLVFRLPASFDVPLLCIPYD